MLLEKLSEKEISLIGYIKDPVFLAETLFENKINNLDSFQNYSEDDFFEVRLYQLPMMSYDYLLVNDPKLTANENFNLRKGSGTAYIFCGRKIGKSICQAIDIILDTIYNFKDWVTVVSSFDQDHVDNLLEPYIKAMKKHPFLKLFKTHVKRKPTTITTEHGHTVKGVNMALSSRECGSQFESQHANKMILDEAQYETDEVLKKRSQAVSELGTIERLSGITSFKKISPAGKIFTSLEKKNWLVNFPQFVSEAWNEERKKEAMNDYGDESAPGWRIHVKAELCEDLKGLYQIDRIRSCYHPHNLKKPVKRFEINKETLCLFKDRIIIERPTNVKRCWIAADFGVTAPTEIIIIFEIEQPDKTVLYRYIYNITLYELIPDEQTEIFKYIIKELKADYISLDCSIDKEEFVLCRIDNVIKIIKIKELENYLKSSIEVPTYKDTKLEWKKANLWKHSYKGTMYKVSTFPGNYNVKVTDSHSLMIMDKTGLIEKKVQDCKENDWMLCPKNFSLPEITDYCSLTFLEPHKNSLSKKQFINIKVDEEFAYLLGWAVAEGSIRGNNRYQFSLGNESIEAENIKRLWMKFFKCKATIRIIDKDYQNSKKYYNIKATKSRYIVDCGGNEDSIKEFTNIVGKGSHNKKIPDVIFNSPKSVQLSFLQGYWEGDGCKFPIKNNNKYISNKFNYSFHTVSETLAYQLITLLQMLNYFPRIAETKSFIDKRGINNSKSFIINFSGFDIKKGLWTGVPLNLIYNRKNNPMVFDIKKLGKHLSELNQQKLQKYLDGDWCFKKIKKIEKYDYNDDVYDLIVKDNHTFVAGCGNLLVHNTELGAQQIVKDLGSIISSNNLVSVGFNTKILTGYAKNDDGSLKVENGELIKEEAYTIDWAVEQVKDLFYKQKIDCYYDLKLDKQFNGMVVARMTNRNKYGCTSGEDHLHAAFLVFGIAKFLKAENIDKPKIQDWGLGITTSI